MQPAPARRSRSLRLATIAVLFTFGCASVRAPATVLPDSIPIHAGSADPQLALWVEGGEAPTQAEQQAAAGAAQRALAEGARGLQAPGAGDGILVVRAQGITRTSGRRSNQVAGAAGLVVGIVVVVAVVILMLSEGKGGGGGRAPKASSGGARAAPTPARAAPAVARAGGGTRAPIPLPVPGPRVRPVRPVARPAPVPYAVPPRYPHDGVYVWGDPWVSWGLYVDLTPPPAPYAEPAYAPQGGFQQPVGSYVVAPPGAEAAQEAAAEDAPDEELPQAPPELTEIRLGPPEPLPLDDRGFFAGDELLVELVVCDRTTGEPRLRKVARKEIDPTDPAKVREFLRHAVTEKKGWEPVVATASPAP
jgi:hypothetical protein